MTARTTAAPARFTPRTALGASLLLVALALPLVLPLFQVTLLTNVLIFSVVVVGLVLLTGVIGLTSFGQAAFMGVGGYATAILSTRYGWSPWLGLLAGLTLTGLVAWALGLLTLRMQGHYLPLATIAWGISLYYVFGNTPALGGFTGITDIPPVRLLVWELTSPRQYAYLALAALLLVLWLAGHLLSSRVGRAMRALRGGPVVAEAFGVNNFRLKVEVFVLSALAAALAGWLYAHSQRFVNPTPFGINAGIEYLFMGVVGGIQYLLGAVFGAALITQLREVLQDFLPRLIGAQGNFEVIFFGVLVILTLQFARRGLWPLVERLLPQDRLRILPPGPAFPERPKPAPGTPLLSVQNAVKQFGGLRAVDDVSFELRAGEILGLIGPNGAGKSTMFNLITGVNPATSGQITFAGQDISRAGAGTIHRLGLSRTFQHVHLLPELTLLENTMMGGYARGRAGMVQSMLHLERAEEAALQHEALRQLQRVGLGAQAFDLAGNLALGQQRILEVARALVADPTLLLLDEPAAGLRYGEKQELSALLKRLRDEGVTILIVEHDMDLVMNLVDRLVVMNYGQKLAQGSPAEIRENQGVREAYLGVDMTEPQEQPGHNPPGQEQRAGGAA
ncbi:amino acid/amide ABC transporter membrane protein 2, HAAT family (TC 3.A.1.4.-)/amino acid/amide ABC transporter ATP-binding protein 1, HAAT family (TC 3.A.1.4.-) [Deinococcus reticulitermitis]|uniref:Amino acid/amide ABC transporter membrane protein 2, HAAT family (TC 3.A.1.4.-)/amino acid/amide ABC transporter ATP-binding protein 1, HAAT family (TC 3.A.1.4.-) n=1 Tax=Deinococcus reticulitermitis TaxID=856736 RepID=A0A1H6ZDR7_9DEIO|nr:branched-chain amino acid ABC transporter ATP-binding protein/permease [Deinococcus reticulitermitis]SEJ50264.1 amino acid/amide ABC transporter membrane protein 2, HAAT family (TC 3.A.1.4.-)/amino acid/amide ABC transporter ATP-binding protein 1, HAAT family (TC 3.A.1.4.-) [Deinococcus reticulitermitis]